MGFGILFIGYFFTFLGAITPLSTYCYVIGTGIIIYSLKNLIFENKLFLATLITSIILEVVSITKMIMDVFGYVDTTAFNVINLIQGYLTPLLNVILLVAIYLIAKQVGLIKVQAKAIVDIIIVGIYVVSAIILNLISNQFAKERLFVVSVIAQLIYTVFTIVIIFNCYARICYEGDENMEKETGNKPLDFLNRALDKVMNKNKDNKTGKKK